MMFLLPIIIAAVCFATYLSSVNFGLLRLSRSALQRTLDKRGRRDAADWLHDQMDCAILATALLRTLTRMSVYVLLLAWMIDLRSQALVTWPELLLSGVAAAVIIWFSTIVLGSAIARHAGTELVASSLPLLRGITWLCTPFARIGRSINDLVRRAIGSRGQQEAEAGLLESIEDVHREGALDVQSAEILENVVEFTNTEVSDVMTPRAEIEGIEYTDDLGSIRAFIEQAGHSRIPVYRGSVENIVGILYVKDLVKYLGRDVPEFKLAPLLRKPIVVPETKRVKEMLSDFQRGEVHMAIVIDEYGSTAGLVTIEDVLEEIVGEIRDEHEPQEHAEPELRSLDQNRAEVDGRFRIDELNQRLGLSIPTDGYDTVAGFVMSHLGRVPAAGESFAAHGARFTALQTTPRRIQRVGIELMDQRPGASQADHRADQPAAASALTHRAAGQPRSGRTVAPIRDR